MKNNLLRGTLIIIIVLICLTSVVSAQNNKTSAPDESQVLTLSKGGLSIDYPSNWGYSESTSEYSIMAISKLDSIDASGVSQININFEKKPLEGDFVTFVNDTYNALQTDSSFELVSSGDVAISDRAAIEYIYISDDNGSEREHKAVWFEKGGQAYVMLYSAPVDQFESNLYVFDYILSTIKIT